MKVTLSLRTKSAVFLLASVAALMSWSAAHAQAPRLEVVATGLENAWGLAFLPDNRYLVTERAGRMRVIGTDGKPGAPLAGVPAVAAAGQGGLLDLVLDSGFAQNRRIFFCFSEAGTGGNSTALASAVLAPDATSLQQVQVIFSQKPKVQSSLHFGCRIVETKDGKLFMTLGERYSRMQDAQTLDNHHGKVVRINKDGSVPKDNPFASRAGALPEIWSYGHRNPQGAALAPDGTFWMHEHGPQGGDEINLPKAGLNYGWPVITYGEQYGGGNIGDGITSKAGLEQPLHYWKPSIAPSGMAFLTSDRYGAAWKGNLFVGSLKFAYLDRIELSGGKVAKESKIEIGERVRDLRQGPDGLLYVLTDSNRGRLIRLMP